MVDLLTGAGLLRERFANPDQFLAALESNLNDANRNAIATDLLLGLMSGAQVRGGNALRLHADQLRPGSGSGLRRPADCDVSFPDVMREIHGRMPANRHDAELQASHKGTLEHVTKGIGTGGLVSCDIVDGPHSVFNDGEVWAEVRVNVGGHQIDTVHLEMHGWEMPNDWNVPSNQVLLPVSGVYRLCEKPEIVTAGRISQALWRLNSDVDLDLEIAVKRMADVELTREVMPLDARLMTDRFASQRTFEELAPERIATILGEAEWGTAREMYDKFRDEQDLELPDFSVLRERFHDTVRYLLAEDADGLSKHLGQRQSFGRRAVAAAVRMGRPADRARPRTSR